MKKLKERISLFLMYIVAQAKFVLAHPPQGNHEQKGKKKTFMLCKKTKDGPNILVLFVSHNQCFDISNITYDFPSFI